tara:strand:- start:3 stop:374 length:372 start_codon:yes stop_codon:yes gene_type:complete
MANSKATKIESVKVKVYADSEVRLLRKIASKRLVKINREWKMIRQESNREEESLKRKNPGSRQPDQKDRALTRAYDIANDSLVRERWLWESIMSQLPPEAERGVIFNEHKWDFDFQEDEYAEE